jgi:hypothetical protein
MCHDFVTAEITDSKLRPQLSAKENSLPMGPQWANQLLRSLRAICRSQSSPTAYTKAAAVAVIMIYPGMVKNLNHWRVKKFIDKIIRSSFESDRIG